MVSPDPAQVSHGLSITSPRPPHRGHGWLIEKKPWLSESMPRPPQRGQTIGEVPGFAPLPRQVAQVACFGTVTATSAPSIACSNDSCTSVSRSRPRAGACRGAAAAPEDGREDVAEVGGEAAAAEPRAAAEAGEHAAGVVLLALLGVRERVVGLLDLLEALLGLRVVLVAVGVVLARQLAVGALDLVRGRLAARPRAPSRGRGWPLAAPTR